MVRAIVARNVQRMLHDLHGTGHTEFADHRLVELREVQRQTRKRGDFGIRGAGMDQPKLDIRQCGEIGDFVIRFIV